MRIDLHTHSNCSDGTDSVPELVEAARRAGLDVIALTDHDSMAGVASAKELAATAGIGLLRGIEVSSRAEHEGETFDVHVLAYGCSPDDRLLADMLEATRQARRRRVPEILRRLSAIGMVVSLEEVAARSGSADSIGRPHIADAMVAQGLAPDRDTVFRRYLAPGGPAFVPKESPSLDRVLDAIRQAHGVAVLAHPWSRGNDRLMTRSRLAELTRLHGLVGLEADHVDHTPQMRHTLKEIAGELGLIVTGSSDYHGTGKTKNPLGVFCTSEGSYAALVEGIESRKGTP